MKAPVNVEVHYFRKRTGTWSARVRWADQTRVVDTHERRLFLAMLAVSRALHETEADLATHPGVG